jgi:hypothetical protein
MTTPSCPFNSSITNSGNFTGFDLALVSHHPRNLV